MLAVFLIFSVVVLATAGTLHFLDDRESVVIRAVNFLPEWADGPDPGTEDFLGYSAGYIREVIVGGETYSREWYLENKASLRRVDLVWVAPPEEWWEENIPTPEVWGGQLD